MSISLIDKFNAMNEAVHWALMDYIFTYDKVTDTQDVYDYAATITEEAHDLYLFEDGLIYQAESMGNYDRGVYGVYAITLVTN